LFATSNPIDSTAIKPLTSKYSANHAAVIPYAMMRDLADIIFDSSERQWWGEKKQEKEPLKLYK
jgi:hypothetical protein